jgi:hypothetical protein
MKFIPGPVGLIARGVDMAINVGKGIHAAVQARRNGGSVRDAFKAFGGHAANAAMGMVPGGKFLRMGKGLIGGAAKGVVGNLLRGGGKGVGNLLRGGAKQILGKRGKGFAGVAKTVMNAAKSKALNRFRGAVNTVRQQQQQKSQQRPAQRAPPRRPAPRRRR